MEKTTGTFKAIKTHIKEHIDDRITLAKLKIVEKSSKLLASLFTAFIMIVLVFCIIIFLSIMIGDWFAVLLGSQFKGFALVAGIYVLLLLFVLTIGKKLVNSFLINRIISLFFDKKEHPNNSKHENN